MNEKEGSGYPAGTEGRRGRIWSLMFTLNLLLTLCCFIVGQGLNSGTSVYINVCGGSAAYAGTLAAVFSVAAAFVRLLSGPIIDSKGRRIVILAGTAVLVVGTIMPAADHGPAAFAIARLLQGAGFSATTTAAATVAADTLPAARMGEGIGFYGLGQAIAMSIGPALALFLVSTNPAENLFYGLCASALTAGLLALFCRYEKHPELLPQDATYRLRAENGEFDSSAQEKERGGLAQRVFEKRALPGAIPQLVICPAFGFGIFFVGLYGTTLGCQNAGLFYTIAAVSMVVVRIKAAALMDRVAPLRLMTFAVSMGLAAYAMLLLCGTALSGNAMLDFVFCAAGIPYGLCLGVSMPLNQSIAVKNTPPSRWGAANALFQLAIDCGIGAVCLLWGIINDVFGFPVTIVCVMAFIAASLFVAKLCYPKQ